MLRFAALILLLALSWTMALADERTDANRLAYLDACNPWYPQKDFPKLITPQWVGEEGVEAVIVLGIDDMRDPAKYEQYLRPILNRLKQIDGRAPVSIMTNEVKADDPQLRSWLGEGLSIECHTIDHPCPILQGGDFAKAKSTYDRCVDLMGTIPGNKPVAFRTPCCDSLNTVSPRFFAEIFDSTTKDGNFLQIDSSVFTFFTSEDDSLPKELVLDADGKERFWKYLPKHNKYGGNEHDNFVNYIKNYPYPYVINNSCWEIPCIAPSDWSAQHLHGINNPLTVDDWKAAIDLTVHKQGCFSLVFHPHGWIKPEQVVEMIDYAVAKHGKKVKFLNFAEVAERLNRTLGDGRDWRDWNSLESAKLPNLPNKVILHGEPVLFYASHNHKMKKTIMVVASPEVTKIAITDDVVESIESADPATRFPADWEEVSFPTEKILPIIRPDGSNNGFFLLNGDLCWINEDTANLPDLMYRVSFDEILAEHKKASGRASALRGNSHGEERQNAHGGLTPNRSPTHEPTPIGAAVVDITPEYPVRLTGYGNRMKESERVAARIHARAMVIGGPNVAVSLRRAEPSATPLESGTPVAKSQANPPDGVALADESENQKAHHAERDGYTVLLTVDNCGVPIEITEAVFAKLREKHPLNRERFAISSTHTHSGPWLRGFAPNIFDAIPDDHAAHLAQYESELIGKLVEVVDKAIVARRQGHLSSGFGETSFAMNRRLIADGKWTNFGEVPDGPTDKRVPVLAAHDTEGKLIAVLANYACHCTTETGEFNQISGDWAGFAADMLETDHPGAVALIAIGCGADANPSPRGTHEQAKVHGRTMADEVNRLLNVAVTLRRDEPSGTPRDLGAPSPAPEGPAASELALGDASERTTLISTERDGYLRRINPEITCNLARIDLPLGPLPTRAEWEELAKRPGVEGSRARYFLKMLHDGKEIPTTIPDYPVQTWCFGDDLAMVFLGGEVVVDYSIRMNDMFDSNRLWINAYSNDVPCYIASARVLREGGYECDSSMLYYRRSTRLAPEAEDVLCDAVQKIMPHEFYSENLQQDFPAPKSPEESLKCMTTKPDLRIVLAASEPLIRDPVAFDWDERGRLWVVEMGDYPGGQSEERNEESRASQDRSSSALRSPLSAFPSGRVRMLEDTDKNGVYDKATTFLDNLAFPNGIHCWRGGVIVTMAPEIFYAEDTNGDNVADVRETMYQGFVEGNQQHRVNGLRWGLDGWLYLANGDSGGEIAGTGFIPRAPVSGAMSVPQEDRPETLQSEQQQNALGELTPLRAPMSLRGRDLRIHPDTNSLDTVSGQTQFGRERDDFGNWFGNNNSNPIWQYVLEDRYVRRNPHAGISQVTAPVAVVPGAAPVYPTSRTLARFNDFAYANRFTSACSTMIYRDNSLGEQYYGNAFTSEPVHNLVSRLVMTRDGYGFKGERAADEQQSEFLASSDNWFRPTMIRTGPDGAIWVADMYRAAIEHPEWIPPEYQRKMNLYAGSDRGRIYRIVPASECCRETVAVSSRADEPLTAQHDAGIPNVESKEASAKDNAGDSMAERDGYFEQPWNEIPIEALLRRLESPNGWWRDLAHRILLHRAREVLEDNALNELLQRKLDGPTIRSTVQKMALLTYIGEAAGDLNGAAQIRSLVHHEAQNEHPLVRRFVIQCFELGFSTDTTLDFLIPTFQPLIRDPDSAVRLQAALSLGGVRGNAAAGLLAEIMRRDFNDPLIRSAALTSLNSENIVDVLNEILKTPENERNEDLVALILGQAMAIGDVKLIEQPLIRLVDAINSESQEAHLSLLVATLGQIGRGNRDQISKGILVNALSAMQHRLTTLVIDRTAEPSRRAAAIRLLSFSRDYCWPGEIMATDFLTKQDPLEVQTAAIEMIARNDDLRVTRDFFEFWPGLSPQARGEAMNLFLKRDATAIPLLDAIDAGQLNVTDFDAIQRDLLFNHGNNMIAERSRRLLGNATPSPRAAVVESFQSQISNLKLEISRDEQATAGKQIFEKRCATCHRLQNIGKELGADLAALKDRSTDALLTAILDPGKAVEAKFLVYTVVTKEGLQHSGMLKGETGGSLTLIGSDGKEVTVGRADIEVLMGSQRSLMPEGLEKDVSAEDLACVIAFVQSTGTPWKRFDGNSPAFVAANADGTVTLSAAAAEIYGPSLVFEEKYGNLGFWTSADDYAKWTFEVPKSGHWTVEFDFACDDSTAGSLIKFSTGNRMLTARVPGSGTWDNYQTWQAGTIDLHRGRGQMIITAPEKPAFALIDLRAVRLIPPK